MPDNTTATLSDKEPTGSPFDSTEADSSHVELSPAELGIDTAPVQTDPTRQPAAKPQDNQPPQDEDIIGKALKRGRPSRDLSDLDDAEKELFQNMSLQAYEKLYPFYKQFRGKDKDLSEVDNLKKELESLRLSQPKSSSYYDHPDAFLLQQEYRDALMEGSSLEQVADHWQKQYIAARSNQPVRDLIQGPNGQLQLGPEIQPSPQVEAQIQSLLLDAKQAQTNHRTKLESLRTAHSERYNSYKTGLDTAYKKIIGPYADQLKPLIDKNLQLFPEFVRGRQETQAIAGLYALLQQVISQDKSEKQATALATATKQGARSAGPTARSITTAPKSGNNVTSAEEEKAIRLQFGI